MTELTTTDYSFLMALTGSLVGFTFLFISCFLAVLIGGK